MPNKKKNDTKYCEGCLTSSLSRTLKPIEDYYHIYSLLTNNELEKTRQDVYPLMCWECLAMLRNVIKFQERCKTANSYLMKHIGKAKRKAMHLSDLMKTNNNTWFEMTHEEEEQIHIYQVVSLNPICTEERSQQTVMETDSETEEDRDLIQEIDCKEIKKEVDLYDDGDIECKQELIDIEEEKIKCKKEIKEENASDLEQRNDETQQRKIEEFKKHHKNDHSKVICDYCNKTMCSKRKLISHICRLHTDHKCLQCNRTFSSYNSIQKHNRMSHTSSSSELCYCVECDVQFGNIYKYRRHIENSTRHKACCNCPAMSDLNQKLSKADLLEKKRNAERLRYQLLKNNPEKWNQQQAKERVKYQRKKEKGQRKLVKDMTRREHRVAKNVWKQHQETFRTKTKAAISVNALNRENILSVDSERPILVSVDLTPPTSRCTTRASGSVTPALGSVTLAPGSVTPAPGSVTPAPGSVTPASGSVIPTLGYITPVSTRNFKFYRI